MTQSGLKGEDMRLFSDIKKSQTLAGARRKLSHYRRLRHIAGEEYSPKVTATYSFEPKAPFGSPNRATEDMVTRKVAAWQELEHIEKAINAILDSYVRHVIYEKYCARYRKSDIAIYLDLGYSESEFYRLVERGQLEFAENYRNGKLLVFQEDVEEDFFGRKIEESC